MIRIFGLADAGFIGCGETKWNDGGLSSEHATGQVGKHQGRRFLIADLKSGGFKPPLLEVQL
jgi:hypothetical protein